MSKKRKPQKAPKAPEPLKLDLSYGKLPEGHPFKRLFDPLELCDWPLLNDSVEEALSVGLFQRVPAQSRGRFMDELWRVLKPGAKCTIIVPYWSSVRAIQDPMAQWPPICENSFMYFNKKFREDNGLVAPDYDMTCNFDFSFGYGLEQETASKSDELRPFWAKRHLNAVNDLHLVVVKRPAA